MDFAKRMLAEAHVAATPGAISTSQQGHRYMRFSYAVDPAELATALARLEEWLKRSS
jgi:aspartate/methionine/tyrosine aminotransferase